MKSKTLVITTLCTVAFFSGCSSLTDCPDVEEIKQAGVCADPFYIDKNKDKIDSISYPKLVYIKGRYYSEDNYKEKISEENDKYQKNLKLRGDDNE